MPIPRLEERGGRGTIVTHITNEISHICVYINQLGLQPRLQVYLRVLLHIFELSGFGRMQDAWRHSCWRMDHGWLEQRDEMG